MEASWLTDIVVVLKTDTLFNVQKYVCISPSVSLSLCCVYGGVVCVWWCCVCVCVYVCENTINIAVSTQVALQIDCFYCSCHVVLVAVGVIKKNF